jgi:hypothetical protein
MGYNPTWTNWIYSLNPGANAVVRASRLISRLIAESHPCAVAILCQISIVVKVLSDFRRNLMIRHFVHGLHTHDAATEVGFLEPLLQFPLGLAGTKIGRASCRERV